MWNHLGSWACSQTYDGSSIHKEGHYWGMSQCLFKRLECSLGTMTPRGGGAQIPLGCLQSS